MCDLEPEDEGQDAADEHAEESHADEAETEGEAAAELGAAEEDVGDVETVKAGGHPGKGEEGDG